LRAILPVSVKILWAKQMERQVNAETPKAIPF
jgi:hypothetical protein